MITPGEVRQLYQAFGQQKPMGNSAPTTTQPHYFLLRTFHGENDLLVILNTKRCRYRCFFCQLPAKSSPYFIPGEDILAQFGYVLHEAKHALSILDRVTLSNEGSVLDAVTLPRETLLQIARCIHELRRVRRLVLETRLEFVDPAFIQQIKDAAPRVTVNLLTGFETYTPFIRDEILGKREPLPQFEQGLDRVAASGADLSAYVLYKPVPEMTDAEAFAEADRTICYLREQCARRGIRLSIRLNPMYVAKGSRWAKRAATIPQYRPPRLTDIMRLAEKHAVEGLRVYIGMSTEGLDEPNGSYASREDYSPALIKPVKLFNDCKIVRFDWTALGLPERPEWHDQPVAPAVTWPEFALTAS